MIGHHHTNLNPDAPFHHDYSPPTFPTLNKKAGGFRRILVVFHLKNQKTCCNHCCQQLAPVGLDINFGSSKSCVLKGLVPKERAIVLANVLGRKPSTSPGLTIQIGTSALESLSKTKRVVTKCSSTRLPPRKHPPGNFLYRISCTVHIFYSTGLVLRPL